MASWKNMVVGLTLASACGGSSVSVLHAIGKPTGEGAAALVVKNASGVTIGQLYVAKMARVQAAAATAVDPTSPEGSAIWGGDQLGNGGIGDGSTFDGLRLPQDRYDVLVLDSDRREQLVKGITLRAGGKYVLEIRDDWALAH